MEGVPSESVGVPQGSGEMSWKAQIRLCMSWRRWILWSGAAQREHGYVHRYEHRKAMESKHGYVWVKKGWEWGRLTQTTCNLWTTLVASLLPGPIQGVGYAFKVVHGMDPVWNRICSITPACPTWSGRESMLWTLSVKGYRLVRSRKRVFSTIASTLWNIFHSEMRWTLTVLAFWKGVKRWLCSLAWESQRNIIHSLGAG